MVCPNSAEIKPREWTLGEYPEELFDILVVEPPPTKTQASVKGHPSTTHSLIHN